MFLSTISSFGNYLSFTFRVIFGILSCKPNIPNIREEIYSSGLMSLSVITLTGISTGLVLAAQSYYQLYNKGLVSLTGLMVAKAMLTELGPILTGFMFVGRVGAAMTASLSTMYITEQIDAIVSMGVDPFRYLIYPKFIATLTLFPILGVYSIFTGILGAYILSVYIFQISPITFLTPIPLYVDISDIVTSIVKLFIFGLISVSISCYYGMHTRGGTADIGFATTKTVVYSYSSILIVNFLLTVALNVLYSFFVGI